MGSRNTSTSLQVSVRRKQADHFQSFWQLFPEGGTASPQRMNYNACLWQQRPIFLSAFYSLETFLKSLINPSKQLSFTLNKWWKLNRAPLRFYESSTFWGGVHFKILYSESKDPNAVISPHHQVVFNLTMQQDSISPCPNTAPLVNSTVNQGRTPLLWDKIREAWSAQEWI